MAFWRELVAHYPDAKVILTVRDPHRWFESMDRTILAAQRAGRHPVTGPLMRLGARFRPDIGAFFAMTERVVRQRPLGGELEGADAFADLFERHTADVIRSVPAERLLAFEVADGWKPLCDFLGAAQPDEPFPHVNDAADFQAIRRAQSARVLRPAIAALAATAALTGAAVATTLAIRRRLR